MSNEEDYSDMPPLIYDEDVNTPTLIKTLEDNENVVKDNVIEDEKENVDDTETLTNDENEEDIEEDDNKEENAETYSENSEDCEKEDTSESCDEFSSVFVLSNGDQPLRYSTDYQEVCLYRDQLVKKDTYNFGSNGTVYVSHTKTHKNTEKTVLSYMDRNLLWNTERIIKTFTIHRINKI